ncbi:hypothetical protein CARN8_1040002 [mine drainage metagenome]|uniref:Uncharacterized protein n=1 Tax=mine drainage metagenome TaxID=410659 RepID=A0A3P3ZLC6_9ZZZZ
MGIRIDLKVLIPDIPPSYQRDGIVHDE